MSLFLSIARGTPLLASLLATALIAGCAEAHPNLCDEGADCTTAASDLIVLEREPEGATGEAVLREVGAGGTIGPAIRIELPPDGRAISYEQGPSLDVGLLWVATRDHLGPHLVELSTQERVDFIAEAQRLTPECGADPWIHSRVYFDQDGRGAVFTCGPPDDTSRIALVHVDLDAPSWVIEDAGPVTLTTDDDRALVRVCLADGCSGSEWRWVDLDDGEMRDAPGLEWFDDPVFWDAGRAGIWLAPFYADGAETGRLQLVLSDGAREDGPELPRGTRLVALSPDGATLATMLPLWDRTGSAHEDVDELTVWSTRSWASVDVELTCTRPFGPVGPPRVSWAPDGGAFTFSCAEETWLVDARDPGAMLLASELSNRAAWTLDGSSILLELLPTGFTLLDARSGAPRAASWVESVEVRAVQLRRSARRRACSGLASC